MSPSADEARRLLALLSDQGDEGNAGLARPIVDKNGTVLARPDHGRVRLTAAGGRLLLAAGVRG